MKNLKTTLLLPLVAIAFISNSCSSNKIDFQILGSAAKVLQTEEGTFNPFFTLGYEYGTVKEVEAEALTSGDILSGTIVDNFYYSDGKTAFNTLSELNQRYRFKATSTNNKTFTHSISLNFPSSCILGDMPDEKAFEFFIGGNIATLIINSAIPNAMVYGFYIEDRDGNFYEMAYRPITGNLPADIEVTITINGGYTVYPMAGAYNSNGVYMVRKYGEGIQI